MVRIGIAGIGFMGMIHYLAAQRVAGARVTAICTRDPKKRAGDWRGIRGNFGPEGTRLDLSGVRTWEKLEDLAADPEVDLVDICLPTHLHAQAALLFLRAGKHVLVEKPIALQAEEAAEMVRTARQCRRLLMTAQVLPFFAEFAYALEYLRSGRGGRVRAAHFERIISPPDWSADIADPAKTGGPIVDLHIHDTHFILLALGRPQAVFSTGVVHQGVVEHVATHYLFGPDGPCVTCTSGAICQKGRPFTHGYEIYCERATLLYHAGTQPVTLLHADGHVETPALGGSDDPLDAFAREIATAVDGIAADCEPQLLSGELAALALHVCRLEEASVLHKQPLPV
ncbi:MAG: oxidoreductase [Gemmataceae bacterium]